MSDEKDDVLETVVKRLREQIKVHREMHPHQTTDFILSVSDKEAEALVGASGVAEETQAEEGAGDEKEGDDEPEEDERRKPKSKPKKKKPPPPRVAVRKKKRK